LKQRVIILRLFFYKVKQVKLWWKRRLWIIGYYLLEEISYGLLKKNSWALVLQQTIPTERLPLVSEVSANFSR
jgi:hypothetical protein